MHRASTLLAQTAAAAATAAHPLITHEVLNQVAIPSNFNSFATNQRLVDAVTTLAQPTKADVTRLNAYGKIVGSDYWQDRAKLANDNGPVYTPFDRQGRRIDAATFHDSYHQLMGVAIENSVTSSCHAAARTGWKGEDGTVSSKRHVVRAAMSLMHYQLECGTSCPLTMTFACVPPLAKWVQSQRTAPHPDSPPAAWWQDWVDKLTAPAYDPTDVHVSLKAGATCGMSMTEKQGGSDVRSNTTVATKKESGDGFSIVGHKWFTSAPMCDAFLTLANIQSPKGPQLSCFLIPRWLAPGQRNIGLRVQRLKTKLGDKSNASSELEYHGCTGYLIGAPGQGVRTIIDMVQHTRLDCLLGSAGLMQASLTWAVNHATQRAAFGAKLIDKPLMGQVLADLSLEAEGAVALAMRISSTFDSPATEGTFQRIGVAIAKYYVCKRAAGFVYESLECMGGNGYVEDFPLARWFRQSPLNAIWEGSGNVIVLDVFRALAKEPATSDAILAEVMGACGEDDRVKKAAEEAIAMTKMPDAEANGRFIVERLALVLEACALRRTGGPAEIYEAFVTSRLGGQRPNLALFGSLAPVPKATVALLLQRQALQY